MKFETIEVNTIQLFEFANRLDGDYKYSICFMIDGSFVVMQNDSPIFQCDNIGEAYYFFDALDYIGYISEQEDAVEWALEPFFKALRDYFN